MPFSHPNTKEPLSPDARRERDARARRDEERRERIMVAQRLEALRIPHTPPPITAPPVPLDAWAATFAQVAADGAAHLTAALAEADLDYEQPLAQRDYARTVAGLHRAISERQWRPLLTPTERGALLAFCAEELGRTVDQLVEEAESARQAAQNYAAARLRGWDRRARPHPAAPISEEAETTLYGPDEDPGGYFERAPVARRPHAELEERELMPGVQEYRITYPAPREE